MTSLSLLPHTFTGLGLPCLRGHAVKMWPLWVGIYSVAIQAFVGRNGLFSKHCCLCWVTLFGRGFIMSQHTAGFMSIFAYTVNVGSSSNQDISIYIYRYIRSPIWDRKKMGVTYLSLACSWGTSFQPTGQRQDWTNGSCGQAHGPR